VRIASWNINHWQRRRDADRWESLERALRDSQVDVALLQETGRPPERLPHVYEELTAKTLIGWGTAVVSLNPDVALERISWEPADGHVTPGSYGCSHPGTIAAARLRVDGSVLNVASAYGRMFSAGNDVTYASTTMHRIISDLAPLLDRYQGTPEVVVGGDFNCTTQWERTRDRLMDASVFQRLEAHGTVDLLRRSFRDRPQLANCFCPEAGSCAHVRTHRHRDSAESRPFQDDYLFASEGLADRGRAFVIDTDDVWALSDHCIVAFDVELASV